MPVWSRQHHASASMIKLPCQARLVIPIQKAVSHGGAGCLVTEVFVAFGRKQYFFGSVIRWSNDETTFIFEVYFQKLHHTGILCWLIFQDILKIYSPSPT